MHALVIGGTGFVGRHTAAELLVHDYEVTVLSRGTQPPDSSDEVARVVADRTDDAELEAIAADVDPDLVADCALFHPEDARRAIRIFADVDAYVYVSSGGVYDAHEIPKREEDTPLHEFSSEHAADESLATYGPRKAECDRIVCRAADQGVNATAVRPTMIYGPKRIQNDAPAPSAVSWVEDFTGIQDHHDYWVDRVDRFDRVVVPGDGTAIWHRVYVEDVASAIRVVAEEGTPGEAYNVADRQVYTMQDVIESIAETLDTSIEIIHASERELARVDLNPDDFVLYHHLGSRYPHVLATSKLAQLGWSSTPPEVAMERTVAEAQASDRQGSAFDPGREAEERLLSHLNG